MKRMVPGAAVTLAVLCSCGGTLDPASADSAEVTFVYRAATERDPAIADCGVGETHIHPSWLGFRREDLIAQGPDEWRITFRGVPVGKRLSVRVSDANACDRDPNGATTENVSANGVLLTRVVDTPGNGTEPGLSFSVGADGTVSP